MLDRQMDDGNLEAGMHPARLHQLARVHHREMSSPTYRVTLVHLTADASALAPASERLELGNLPLEEIIRLAGRLSRLEMSGNPKAEPGIIVHRGDRSYRIAVHQGRIRVHKSVSLFDDYWTAESANNLGSLPPFQLGSTPFAPPRHAPGAQEKRQSAAFDP